MLFSQTMVKMVMDQRTFGIHDRLFHGLQLLGNIDTGFARFDHFYHRTQMPVGAF